MDDFFAAFSPQSEREQEEYIEEDEIFEIEILQSNEEILNIYRIVQNYFGGFGTLDTVSGLILALVQKKDIDIEDVLIYLPYIHYAYLQEVTPDTKE